MTGPAVARDTPAPAALVTLLPALLAPPAALLGLWSGRALLLPLLATAAIYPVYAGLILRGRPGAAAFAAVLWAAALSATIIAVTARDPARAGGAVLNGPAYREEMFAFIASGHGRESEPTRFLPQHLLHLAAFTVLTAASGGLLGLVLGACLVDYMSYYVGALAAGPQPAMAAALGWPPYAVLRVVAFILLGTVLARPVLARLAGRAPAVMRVRVWVGAAMALLVADAALKALLAERWAALLRPCLGPLAGSP
jgi:hypothetical protein